MDNWNFVVVCRDDLQADGTPGAYTLATRRVFATREAATRYAAGVAVTREPIVVEGRWFQLRAN